MVPSLRYTYVRTSSLARSEDHSPPSSAMLNSALNDAGSESPVRFEGYCPGSCSGCFKANIKTAVRT
jgi:hypothetical protein